MQSRELKFEELETLFMFSLSQKPTLNKSININKMYHPPWSYVCMKLEDLHLKFLTSPYFIKYNAIEINFIL